MIFDVRLDLKRNKRTIRVTINEPDPPLKRYELGYALFEIAIPLLLKHHDDKLQRLERLISKRKLI